MAHIPADAQTFEFLSRDPYPEVKQSNSTIHWGERNISLKQINSLNAYHIEPWTYSNYSIRPTAELWLFDRIKLYLFRTTCSVFQTFSSGNLKDLEFVD